MTTKVLSFALVLMFVTLSIPSESDAWAPLIREGLRRAGEWANSPSGQKTFRDWVQKPGMDEKVKKGWDWVKDTAKKMKEDIQDGINELRDTNPFCTICSMTGKHICGGTK